MKPNFIVIAVTLLALGKGQAQTPVPPKSSITVRETMSDVPGPKPEPGKKCKLDHHVVTYTPTVVFGADAQDAPVTWRFYAGIQTPRGKGVKLVSEKIIPPGVPTTFGPITADTSLWACSCCRPINKDSAKVIGWYAELVKADKAIAQARSTSGGMEITDFVVKKQAAPKDAGAMLSWSSPDMPQTTGGPEEPAPSHIALASRKNLPDTTRMKGPSGRSLYVSNAPVLTVEDFAGAYVSGSSIGKVDSVSLKLTPLGAEKLAAGKPSGDLILVVVNGDTVTADEVSHSTYREDGKEIASLTIRGRLSKIELEDLAETLSPRNRRH